MLRIDRDIYCGVYDSSVIRPNKPRSFPRTVENYEIELFHCDGGKSHINGESYPVKRGMLLCAKPGDERYSDFPVRCNFVRISSSEQDGIGDIIGSFPAVTYVEDKEKTDDLLALFGKLRELCISRDESDMTAVRMNSLFLELIYRCMRIYGKSKENRVGGAVNRNVRHAYEFINENYTSDCSLKTIADAVHVTPNYLHTVFAEEIGMTPFEYVTQKRIEKAKSLIMAGDTSMLNVALETGFCSQSHFGKVFKEKCGMTPGEYRKSLIDEY